MAEARLRITAQDATRTAFASVQGNLRQLERQAQAIGKSFSSVRNAVGAVLPVAAVVGFGRAVVEQTVEAEKAAARLDALLRNVGKTVGRTRQDIEAYAQRVSDVTIFDDDAARAAAAELLVFRNVVGQVFDDLLALAPDVAAALSLDLPQAARELGKAFNDPERAGELLRRAGQRLTDTERELIGALKEAGREAEAQAVIFTRLEDTFSGVAKEMNQGMTKATSDLSKAWEDLLKTIGNSSSLNASGFLDNVTKLIKSADAATESFAARLLFLARILPTPFAGIAQGAQSRPRGPSVEGRISPPPPSVADVEKMLADAKAAAAAAAKASGASPNARDERGRRASSSRKDEVQRQFEEEQRLREQAEREAMQMSERAQDIILESLQQAEDEAARISERIQAPIIEAALARERAVEDAIDGFRREREALLDLSREQQAIRDIEAGRYGALTEAQEQAILNEARLTDSVNEAAEAQRQAQDEQARAIEQARDAVEQGESLAETLGLSFASAAEEAIVNWQGFKGLLKGIEQDLVRILTRKLVTEPLANAAGDILSNLLPQIFPFANGGIVRGITPLASGGVLTRPTLALMRERGQNEAVVPLPDGRSIPVSLRGGGATYNLTMNVNGVQDVAGFRRSQQQLAVSMQRLLAQAGRRA